MKKELHATEFDGSTFGMNIDTDTRAYKFFKSQVKIEKCIGIFGTEFDELVVPWVAIASIMEEANWLVKEKWLQHFRIDGFKDGEEIYIRYTDEPINFKTKNWLSTDTNC